jgi:hypothetical protein
VTASFEVEAERPDQLRAEAQDVLLRIAHNVGLNGSDLETDLRDRRGAKVGRATFDFGAPTSTLREDMAARANLHGVV